MKTRILLALLAYSLCGSLQINRAGPQKQIDEGRADNACKQQVVLFGGSTFSNPNGFSNQTWLWDGTNWEQKFAENSPSPREGHAMAPDPLRREILLFGGYTSSNFVADTWIWDGTNWEQKFPATRPSDRAGHALAYDAGSHRDVVLFGGANPGTGPFLNDTWVWDGTNWDQRFPQTSPSGRVYHAMASSDGGEGVVLFGGGFPTYLNDTWVWGGKNWEQKFPTTSPSPRAGHAMTLDKAHRVVVLFGGVNQVGTYLNDTWAWDGREWEQKFPKNNPPASVQAVMAPDGRGVVLFTNMPLAETWVWDGTDWEQKFPEASPATRVQPAIAYDLDGCEAR